MQNTITIPIVRRLGCEDIPLPSYMSEGAAGMDLRAACDGSVTLAPGEVKLVPCGFSMAIPAGYEAQVRPRSGLALKHGVILPNAPGTIDSDYRGEVSVILANISLTDFVVRRGMRVAQMVIAHVVPARLAEAIELPVTVRGDGGFGHTGHH
jgi:dUTP pyrophosphatase